MHYSHMIRFDDMEEARKLQQEIHNLNQRSQEDGIRSMHSEYCSETETEGGDASDDNLDVFSSANIMDSLATNGPMEDFNDDIPLASFVHKKKNSSKVKASQLSLHGMKTHLLCDPAEAPTEGLPELNDDLKSLGRKRVRVVISDDEAEEPKEMDRFKRVLRSSVENVTTSDAEKRLNAPSYANKEKDTSPSNESKDAHSDCTPCLVEESICSFKSKSPGYMDDNDVDFGASGGGRASASKSAASGSKVGQGYAFGSLLQSLNSAGFKQSEDHFLAFKIGEKLIYLDARSCVYEGIRSIEDLKVEVACVYYLQLSEERRSKGLLPNISLLKFCEKDMDSLESIEDIKHLLCEQRCIEVVIDGWVPKRLMKLYVDNCAKLSEAPNMKLLKKLYNLEVSEDEVIVSDCGLQDLSMTPFLNSLQSHKTIAVLDLSHNLLGNETMEKLQQIFSSSSQKYGGLTLDLHCNRFGPTSLFQICECSVMFGRLEILNLSENRLTDACSSYLLTILQNCKALYSLNIEQCSITSRTIQKVADALHEGSVLSQLLIGKNSPVSGNALASLLSKLASLKRFSELSLAGIRLSKIVVDSLCKLAKFSNLSGLCVSGTYIGVDGAVMLTEALSFGCQELMKLDISDCGLTSLDFTKVSANVASFNGIFELNLGGNPIGQEACETLGAMLMDPRCSLKSLILEKCHLGLQGIVQIIQFLPDNDSLEELNVAGNTNKASFEITVQDDLVVEDSPKPADEKPQKMEVADSEDETIKEERHAFSGANGSCSSSCRKDPYAGSRLIQELSEAIACAPLLKKLDLSQNGFSDEIIETLYSSWALSSRCNGAAHRHVDKISVHFLMAGVRCCGVKPCCRRDA